MTETSILKYNDKLARVFLDKPELVIEFPDWLLSERQTDVYRQMDNLAIVEIAGRDSVAAAIKSVAEHEFTDLLPIYAYTGTEYGSWSSVEQAVLRLSSRLPEVNIHQLMILGSPVFWSALNGRFISELIAKYGFYTPCPGCHLYLHGVRMPLAVKLGNVPIISGERESHSGLVKINQTAEALDFFLDFADQFGISMDFPLRHIAQSHEIENILQVPWERGQEQFGCTLSGNYRMNDGTLGPSTGEVIRFFKEFAGPSAREIIGAYIEGNIPDSIGIAESILKRC